MDAEVQEQEELAAKWQAAIDSIEAAGLTVEDGVLTAPIDELDPSLDPDILAALQGSIQAVNQQVSDGELALADIGFDDNTGGDGDRNA
jgi:hypothetical protein